MMDVEGRQEQQLMGELERVQLVPSLTLRAQEDALKRWNRRMNPQGIAIPRRLP